MDHTEYLQHLAQQQWLIPLFPLVAAAIQSLMKRPMRKASGALTIIAMGLSCIFALRAFFATVGSGGEHHEVERAIFNFTWFKFGTSSLDLGFILDPLTAGMAAMVAFVGFWIFVNATGYMADDENFTRFFCFLSLFAASMLGLVISNNLLLLFMCWELVGLCSYLLIGFWYFKPSAAAAMKKAFITTRIGDVGFLLGIVMLYWKTGTLNLYTHDAASSRRVGAGECAGSAKWLVGPVGGEHDCVSPLYRRDGQERAIPAARVVAGRDGRPHARQRAHPRGHDGRGGRVHGRDECIRSSPRNRVHGYWILSMWIGCITAVFSATIAVAQFDIKRVLAYSTCSQLGFMVMGLGAGSLVAGQFHLLTHAFFKALALPRFWLRHHRHAPRAGHAQDGRPAQVHAHHVLVLSLWHVGAVRGTALCGILFQR